jgi:hypothetical protein
MRSIYLLLSTVFLTSCVGMLGPHQLKNDSTTYNRAVQHSNDSQLLLNLVRLRYSDTPTFLQIGIISAAYEFKRTASVKLDDNDSGFFNDGSYSFGAEMIDKPTTSYSPIRGKGFSEEMLTPIKLESILLLNNSGWRIDRVLRTTVQRMNHLKNAPSASGPTPVHAPDYECFLELMNQFKELEIADAVNIVVDVHPKTGKPAIVIALDSCLPYGHIYTRIWDLLDLDPETYHIRLTPYHGRTRARDEVLVDTRSPLSLLYFLSQGVIPPAEDEATGRVMVTMDEAGCYFNWSSVLDGIMTIHHSSPCPDSERTCLKGTRVSYRGYEFYIDDRDLDSKATFSMLSQLFALQGSCPILPAFTISLD